MRPVRHVIFFDLDNTLYPADETYAIGLRAAWRAFQRSTRMSWPRFKRLYDRARADVKVLTAESPSRHNRALYFKRLTELSGGHVNSSVALNLMRAYDTCWAHIDLGTTRDLLVELSYRYKLGLITNQVSLTQLQKMKRIDPSGRLFPVLVTSEDVNAEKPDPKIFKEACARMQCRSSEAYMVGDDWNDDVLGARRAGLKPIFLSKRRPATKQNVLWIRSLQDLPSLLQD